MPNPWCNAVDRHRESGRADRAASIYDSPVTDTVGTYTYRGLRDRVATFAGALAGYGVTRGERAIIYMPMVPEAVIAMLGVFTARSRARRRGPFYCGA